MGVNGKIKRYNFGIVGIVVVFVVFTAIFNYLVDPFDIFRVFSRDSFNAIKPCLSKQERMTKIPYLKLNKNKIDIVYVGSSKTDWWIDSEYQENLTGLSVYSATLSSSSLQESVIMAKNAIFLHPEIKTIYFGLDFFSFSKKFAQGSTDLKIATKKHLTKEEVMPLILSLDTLNYSMKTLQENIKIKNKKEEITTKIVHKNPRAFHYFEQSVKKYDRDYYSDYILNENAYDEIAEFQKFAQNHNIKVIFFVTPTHVYDLVNIHEHGLWNVYKDFKRKLAFCFDYYDMSSLNKYNTENISVDMVYFRDSVHATKDLGGLLAKNFLVKQNDTSHYVTKRNVESYLDKEDVAFQKYYKSHKNVINDVREWIK